jgi:hypothetical protein
LIGGTARSGLLSVSVVDVNQYSLELGGAYGFPFLSLCDVAR